jgi:gamma-glutamylputrescine oxidase
VGITLSRRPFVREVMKNVTSIGGFSGHGVMLSNYCGKLYADHVLGGSEDLEAMRGLKVGPFPGGDKLRKPLLVAGADLVFAQGPLLRAGSSGPGSAVPNK